MNYRLKDKSMHQMLDSISGGDFSKELTLACSSKTWGIDSERPSIMVDFGCPMEVRFFERKEYRPKFEAYFSRDEIEEFDEWSIDLKTKD